MKNYKRNPIRKTLIIIGVSAFLLGILIAVLVFQYGEGGYGGIWDMLEFRDQWKVIYNDDFITFFSREFFNINCFYGYFLVGGCVSFIIGLFLPAKRLNMGTTYYSEENLKVEDEKATQTGNLSVQNNAFSNNNFEYIRNFKKLLDEGIITSEEFEKKKKELLNL